MLVVQGVFRAHEPCFFFFLVEELENHFILITLMRDKNLLHLH